jgi:hypothetical protein
MGTSRFVLAAIALSVVAAGCGQHPPPTGPALPSAPEMPASPPPPNPVNPNPNPSPDTPTRPN